MRRNTSSGLRFALLVYVYVHSRRQSRAFLVLLASPRFYPFQTGENCIQIVMIIQLGSNFIVNKKED